MQPIGRVNSPVTGEKDDRWASVEAEVQLDWRFEPEALQGLGEFSHVEVIFLLDQIAPHAVETKQRHPRNNPKWPKVGIFAQRGRNRPNRIGITICTVVQVSGRTLKVRGLDAFDGSPVLDIKPVLSEFLPDRSAVRQPQWSRELMNTYF